MHSPRHGHRIQSFTPNGAYLLKWGSAGTGNGQFNTPFAVAADPFGNIYVVDEQNYRVQKFGSVITPTRRASWGSLKSLYR